MICVSPFSELSLDELWEILYVRTSVFVVEQACAYQEIDKYDKEAIHIYIKENDQIVAYARVLPEGTVFDEPSIGRVLTTVRRKGYGTQIVKEAICVAQDEFDATHIRIEAQVYAKPFYENLGFEQCSEKFLEDGIPHIEMEWIKNDV